MFKEIIQKLKTWRKDRQQLVAVPDPEPETETPVEEIPGDVLALDDPEGSYGEGIEPECWQWSPGMRLRNGEVQLLQEKDPTEHSRELATLYGIGITADEAAERLRDLGKAITDALKPFVDAMRNMWECLPKWYRAAQRRDSGTYTNTEHRANRRNGRTLWPEKPRSGRNGKEVTTDEIRPVLSVPELRVLT